MTRRLLAACAHAACAHYRAVLLVALGLTLLSLVPPFLFGTEFSASVRKLMPEHHASASAFNRAVSDFGTADEAFVVFRIQHRQDLSAVGKYATRLAKRLRTDPEIQDAYCRYLRPDELEFFENELRRRGLLYVPPAGLQRVEQALSARRIARAARRTSNDLFAGSVQPGQEALLLLRHLGMEAVFREALPGHFRELYDKDADTQGYIAALPDADHDDTLLLLAVRPRGPAQRLEYSRRIMQRIRQTTNQILQEMPPALASPAVTVAYAGGYEVAVRYTHHMQSSLFSTLITSLVGVLLLFGYCYRRYGVILYVGLPLVMIVCWTLGLAWLLFGKLNAISCAFAAVLVGLGVDYAIHIYNRYVTERVKGTDVETSFALSLRHTGHGVLIGMLTTSLSFFALMATEFRGLSQFGILAGLGLAMAVPAMVFVLPALVVWRSKHGQGEHPRALRSITFGLPYLARGIRRRPGLVVGIGLGLAAVSAVYLLVVQNGVRFDERLASLRPSEDPVFELGEEISSRFTRKGTAQQMLLITGPTEAAAMNNAHGLADRLETLRKEGTIKGYEILTAYLPAPRAQRLRKETMESIDFEAAARHLREELDRQGLASEPFAPVFDFFENHASLVRSEDVLLPTEFRDTPIWRLLHRMVGRHKVEYRTDRKRRPNAWHAFDQHGSLVLAELPTSREGLRYFVEDAPVTQLALEYLAAIGVTQVRVRPKDVKDAGGTQVTTLDLDGPNGTKPPGPALVFASTVHNPQGKPVLREGMTVTRLLVTYLREANCRSITCYGEGWTVLAHVNPTEAQIRGVELSATWVRSVREGLAISPTDESGSVFLTGTMVVAHDLARIVKADFLRISCWVAVIAAVVLVVCYRDATRVLLSLTPIAVGLVFLMGLMSVFGISFNFINVLVVPVIIGLGVDNGIHLVHRFFETRGDVGLVVTDTGRAIVITNLTSMVGFGSLWVGSYRGLTSMGRLSVLGLSMSILASLIVLPALMELLRRHALIRFPDQGPPADRRSVNGESS